MKRYLLGFLLLVWAPLALAEKPLAPLTIVVFNTDIPESVELAKFYAQKRGIARDHLVGLSVSRTEEISRLEYDTMIRDPLRKVFKERGWWTLEKGREDGRVIRSAISFVAIIKGIPLKIRSVSDYPGDKPGPAPIADINNASVDSEVAALSNFSTQISGLLPNPYFQSYRSIAEVENASVLLVCRLDAPDATTVRRMITDAHGTVVS